MDTVAITAEEAADRIRQSGLLDEAHQLSPEDRHRANFAGRVCEILGLPATVENFAHVAHAMDELQIVPHEGHEYPKWVKTGRKVQVYDMKTDAWVDGPKDEMVVVHDEDEEAHAGDPPHPADPVNPAPQPRTEVPTSGLVPAQPGSASATADAPAGYPSAGQGKLVQDEVKPAAQAPARAAPKAPTRA